MPDIYEQHKAAFSRVAAWIILDETGERVATVAIKYPSDGAGRLYAYCHLIGVEMQRGYAGGYGYDKHSPAVREAFAKATAYSEGMGLGHGEYAQRINSLRTRINEALSKSDGEYWHRLLEHAGFRVLQAF